MSAKLLILLVKIILQVALDNCGRPVADCIPGAPVEPPDLLRRLKPLRVALKHYLLPATESEEPSAGSELFLCFPFQLPQSD